MNDQDRFWVRFISKWTGKYTVHSFDSLEEAVWYSTQVNGEVYDYHYNVIANHGYKEEDYAI